MMGNGIVFAWLGEIEQGTGPYTSTAHEEPMEAM